MKWLLCGLVTVEKSRGDDLPKNVGEVVEDLHMGLQEVVLRGQRMHQVLE
jgi:hypothetical protein